MTNKLLGYSLLGLQVIILIFVGIIIFGSNHGKVYGGITNFDSLYLQTFTASENSLQVKSVGGSTELTVNGAGGVIISGTSTIATSTFSGAITIGTGGTAISKRVCSAATTWNPGVVGSTTQDGIDIALSGATINSSTPQMLVAGLSTSTQNLVLSVAPSSTGIVHATLSQPDWDAANVDLTTTTIQACYTAN